MAMPLRVEHVTWHDGVKATCERSDLSVETGKMTSILEGRGQLPSFGLQ